MSLYSSVLVYNTSYPVSELIRRTLILNLIQVNHTDKLLVYSSVPIISKSFNYYNYYLRCSLIQIQL